MFEIKDDSSSSSKLASNCEGYSYMKHRVLLPKEEEQRKTMKKHNFFKR